VASYRKIKVVDIRALNSNIDNLEFIQADLMTKLPHELIEASDSISCLHTIEHFGLGRYGDPINANGHLIGFYNLISILRPKGTLYFSTPVGPQRIEFNAHRVFSITYLINKMFDGFVTIKSFSYVDDQGNFHKHVELNEEMISTNFGCTYGCGIFELVKI
jgi:SAM-dependent methyltransferase